MKLELQKSELTIIANALKLLKAQQALAAKALNGIINTDQMKHGIALVDRLREKIEKAKYE